MDQNASIQLIGLYKVYKEEKIEVIALRGVDIKVRRGEFLMIVGPSGCGKTTLMNMIGGLDKPTAGKIFIDGEDISGLNFDDLTRFRRKKVGYVFQFLNLVKSLNAYENVELPLISLGVPAGERKQRVDELLEVVGLRERRLHRPSELSGGEQQRVAIAAALANNPAIILADEPTGELDSRNANEVMNIFKALVQKHPNITVIVVTHDTSLKRYADRIVRMRDGQIEESLDLQYARSDGEPVIFSPQASEGMENARDILPDIPLIADIKACPRCGDQHVNITILRAVDVQKPHPHFQLRDVLLVCNECQAVEKIKVKVFHP